MKRHLVHAYKLARSANPVAYVVLMLVINLVFTLAIIVAILAT